MSRQVVIQELQKPETYLFQNHRQKLIEAGIKDSDPLVVTLDILISQTYSSFVQKQLKLEGKYIKKLKIISILSCFYGKQTISLSQLEKQLACNRQECLNLLVQASIYKLVAVKIDEASNVISIEKAKIREREAKEEIEKYLKGKFIRIKDKNQVLEQSLKQILKEIGGIHKQQEHREEFDLSSLLKKRSQDPFHS